MNVPFYFQAVWKSMSDVRWLREQRKDIARASKYFLGIILVISLVDAIVFSHAFLRDVNGVSKKALEVAPNLSIERKDGNLKASGITEPFVFETITDGQSILIYIDTTTSSAAIPSANLLQAKEKNTFLIAVTSDMIRFVEGSTGKEQTITAVQLPENSVIPYGKTAKHIQEISERKHSLAVVAAIITLILFIFYTIAELIYLAFVTLVAYGVSRVKKYSWTFGELFTVGLFAVTLPLLVDEILSLFGVYIPILTTALLIALLCVVAKEKVEEKTEQV